MKLIIILFILQIVPVILSLLTYPRKAKNPNIICYPLSVLLVGLISLLTILFAVIMMWVQESNNVVTIALTVFIIPLFVGEVYLTISSIWFRFEFYDEFFVYRNILGIRYRFEYTAISKILICYNKSTNEKEQYKVFVEGTTIKINYLMLNFQSFEKNIKRYLKKFNCRCDIEMYQGI